MQYNTRGSVHDTVRQLLSLPYLPDSEIASAFRRTWRHNSLEPLFEYVERQWIAGEQWPPSAWTVYRGLCELTTMLKAGTVVWTTRRLVASCSSMFSFRCCSKRRRSCHCKSSWWTKRNCSDACTYITCLSSLCCLTLISHFYSSAFRHVLTATHYSGAVLCIPLYLTAHCFGFCFGCHCSAVGRSPSPVWWPGMLTTSATRRSVPTISGRR